ncbi:MAG: hypothetical protein P4M14_03795 [Gammaproteobacteria bacterium]|nr:hypothetical protein [Gammaproteobacteria bacterium]
MPDPIQQEPKAKDSPLAALNKLIFRMDASSLRNSDGSVFGLPQAEYKHSKIASTIKECQEAKADMEAKLAAMEPPLPEAAAIKTKMAAAFDKLAALDADVSTKFGDWMGNKRAMDKQAVWDPSFKEVNTALAALHNEINTAVKKNPTNEELKELQGSAKVLNADNLQNKVFDEEVTRLTSVLNQQSRTDFGFRTAAQLGYGDAKGQKQVWKKLHSTDADKVEQKAEEKRALDAYDAEKNSLTGPAAQISVRPEPKDEKWNERLHKKGGPGIYRQEGSDYYMKVNKDATITAVFSPEETSFASKLLYLVAAPLAVVAAAASYIIPFIASDEKSKFRDKVGAYLWNSSSFERGFGELIDFATIDPSGMMKSKSIEMFYDDYKYIGKTQANEILLGLKAAKSRGIGFDMAPELADALIASRDIKQSVKDKIFKEIENYKIEFLAKEKALEVEGEKKMQAKNTTITPPTPPTPPSSTSGTPSATPATATATTTAPTVATMPSTVPAPAMTPEQLAAAKQSGVKLGEVKADLGGEMKGPQLESAVADVKEAKAAVDAVLPNLSHANQEEVAAIKQVVSGVKDCAPLVKDQMDANPDKKDAGLLGEWANWYDAQDEVISRRETEIPLQEAVVQAMIEVGPEGAPARYDGYDRMAFPDVVDEGVDLLKAQAGAMNADGGPRERDDYEKLDGLKGAVEAAASELKPADKAIADKLATVKENELAKAEENRPRKNPGLSPRGSSAS